MKPSALAAFVPALNIHRATATKNGISTSLSNDDSAYRRVGDGCTLTTPPRRPRRLSVRRWLRWSRLPTRPRDANRLLSFAGHQPHPSQGLQLHPGAGRPPWPVHVRAVTRERRSCRTRSSAAVLRADGGRRGGVGEGPAELAGRILLPSTFRTSTCGKSLPGALGLPPLIVSHLTPFSSVYRIGPVSL